MLPSVDITKIDGQTGVVRPSATGVLALVAAATQGALTAGGFTRADSVLTEYGYGHMHEDAAYIFAQTGKPIVAVRATNSTAGAYGAPTITNAGTSVITAGATEPVDEFPVVVQFTTGGTVGSAGIKYKYSINGGDTFSKILALGTATSITIPNTGVSLALAAGTILATTKAVVATTGPKLTNADIAAGLEALRVTSSPFEAVLIDMAADATTVSTCAAWLTTVAAQGKFKTIVITARPRDPISETEAQYKDALAAIFDAAASTDVVVCADQGDLDSVIRGITQARPVGLGVAARGMAISLGTDPAYVALGPIPGFRITDTRGNPKYHDENLFPGLDDLRLTTFRRIDGFEGVYITNANLLSASGSDYVYWQHARTMNRGCEITFQVLTKQLSRGVRKNPKPGPSGERYIAESEAQLLEELANANISRELVTPGAVDDMKAIVSRTDDIRSNAGATITVSLQSVSLGYVKKFKVTAGYVTEIKLPTQAST